MVSVKHGTICSALEARVLHIHICCAFNY